MECGSMLRSHGASRPRCASTPSDVFAGNCPVMGLTGDAEVGAHERGDQRDQQEHCRAEDGDRGPGGEAR